MLKVLDTAFNVVVTLALAFGIFWFGVKVFTTIGQANLFKNMSVQDKAALYIVDREMYNKLERSNDIVYGILEEFGW